MLNVLRDALTSSQTLTRGTMRQTRQRGGHWRFLHGWACPQGPKQDSAASFSAEAKREFVVLWVAHFFDPRQEPHSARLDGLADKRRHSDGRQVVVEREQPLPFGSALERRNEHRVEIRVAHAGLAGGSASNGPLEQRDPSATPG